jgi:hypothetical protein
VRRTVVLRGGKHLRHEDQQDDLPGGRRMRPGAPARAQSDKEQGGEFAPHCPLAYGTHARRSLTRLLALVLP